MHILFVRIIILLALPAHMLMAKDPRPDSLKQRSNTMLKTSGTPAYALLNINNLTSWMRYDGHSNHSPSGDDGLKFPRGTGSAVYQDGLVWGGKVFKDAGLTVPYSPSQFEQNIRVGGGTYGIGTRAGAVIGWGAGAIAEDQISPDARIFRIRRDYFTMDSWELQRDAADVNEINDGGATLAMMDNVRSQYAADWNAWPVGKGAPFIDRNGNGFYDPPPPFNTDPGAGPVFTAESLITQNRDEPGVSGIDMSAPADQVIFTVFNDINVNEAISFVGSEPLGLEIQKTMWGYAGSSYAINSTYFVRYRMINKGGVDTSLTSTQLGSFWIDSMYICQWSDVDLGYAGDDLGGCDTLLSMGFVYNSRLEDPEYALFKLGPPSIGYDILAGPAIPSPGDSAFIGLRWRQGMKNLPMTSFGIWGPGDPYSEPGGGYLEGTGRWWKILRGFAALGSMTTSDVPYAHPPGASQFFRCSGDPVRQTGWVDGMGTQYSFVPSDRRIAMNSGPFTLAPGDTQEIYVACTAGIGADHISSVTYMKFNDRQVQSEFNRGFSVPRPPATPVVRMTALDREIILEWGSNTNAVQATENKVLAGGYAFEGYTVYQLPSEKSALSEGVRIATFDRKNGVRDIVADQFDVTTGLIIPRLLQAGNDLGVRRSIRITHDKLGEKMSGKLSPLTNGQEYYFAVTSYNLNQLPDNLPTSLESTPVIYKAKPRIPFGLRVSEVYGDTLSVQHIAGTGSGTIVPIVVDPLGGTGDTYRLTFLPSPTDSLVWSLENRTLGTYVVSPQLLMASDEEPPIVEAGIKLGVFWTSGTFSPADTFEYTVSAPVAGHEVEKESINRVGVFPNPYLADISGWNSPGGQQRQHVTFNNLPQRAVIRIYNLAGHLVRTLRKDDVSQFFEWNLMNEEGWLIASGVYVCHIELTDLQKSKVLKLAIITAM